ncbi:MAG: hypothetical protein Kow00109_28960 [Acidobacteriota bacterium]
MNPMRWLRKIDRRRREARMFIRSLRDPYRPILVHLIPTRRCNLSCGYCNEFDRHSDPVPTAVLRRRIDKVAELGAGMLHLSGGEPLLHPEVEELVRHIRRRGMLAGLLTNGLLLSRSKIVALNRAGLDHLQISIDTVLPNATTRKNLRALERRLVELARYAWFDVNVNTVLGPDVPNPEDAWTITRRARELGLDHSLGLLHASRGRLKPLQASHREVLFKIQELPASPLRITGLPTYQRRLAEGKPNDWHCPAGARYLYVCEEGLVHYCSQQRGTPGIPLEDYSLEDLVREGKRSKECAPYCTISCVLRVGWVHRLRHDPWRALQDAFPAPPEVPWTPRVLPWWVRLLAAWFAPPPDTGRN